MVNILEEEMQWKQPKNKQEVRMKKLHYSESFHAKKKLWQETKSKFEEVLVPSSKYTSDQN